VGEISVRSTDATNVERRRRRGRRPGKSCPSRPSPMISTLWTSARNRRASTA